MSDAATEPTEPIWGSLELEERDFRRSIVELSWILRARAGVVVGLALLYGTLIFLGHTPMKQMAEPLVVGGLFLGTLFFSPFVRARQSLAAVAAGGDKHASYRFDDVDFTIRTAGATSTTAYRSLIGYRENKTELLLYLSPRVAHIVPKRAFSAADVSRVSARLAANAKQERPRHASRLVFLCLVAILAALVIWQYFSNASVTPFETPRRSATP